LKDFPLAKLVILGKGEEQKDVIELASRLGVSDKVTCHFEFVPEQDRIAHYAASDVCVFPSIYEPFGIVSLEAMSMAKPVVVGAQGVVGFKEQVVPSGPEQNGVHVNGNNPADIAWGIKAMLENPERAKQWGENGRKRVLQYFTWRKAAEQTLGIYESLLPRKDKVLEKQVKTA
jgi:glycosyltransferase involved in cell wall biosynthesis